MSTPRRSWPRSIGTPKIPVGCSSGKGRPSRASGIRRGLEEALRGAPDGVDPAEVHRGFLVGKHLLVAVEVGGGGPGLIGEEVAPGVETPGGKRALQPDPQV